MTYKRGVASVPRWKLTLDQTRNFDFIMEMIERRANSHKIDPIAIAYTMGLETGAFYPSATIEWMERNGFHPSPDDSADGDLFGYDPNLIAEDKAAQK